MSYVDCLACDSRWCGRIRDQDRDCHRMHYANCRFLAQTVAEPLKEHLKRVRDQHEQAMRPGMVVFNCHSLWHESTRTPSSNGDGSIFFRQRGPHEIPAVEPIDDITWTEATFKTLSATPFADSQLRSPPAAIRFATHLQLSCWPTARTFARSKSCWGTRTSKPLRFTHTSCNRIRLPYAVQPTVHHVDASSDREIPRYCSTVTRPNDTTHDRKQRQLVAIQDVTMYPDCQCSGEL